MEEKYSRSYLKQKQSLPLEAKVLLTKKRIKHFAQHFDGDVYVSFSGGKDSTVLMHIVRETLGSYVPSAFVDTGLEYPEIRDFVKTFENVEWLKPDKNFRRVITENGYPVISKKVANGIKNLQNRTDQNEQTCRLFLTGKTADGRDAPSWKLPKKWLRLADAPFKISDECCNIMKKKPLRNYEKKTGMKPFIGTLACESSMREKSYYAHGCNAFDTAHPSSQPLSVWTEQDVLLYIKTRNIPISAIYGDIVRNPDGSLSTTIESRTGCIFCGFGVHMEDKNNNRFTRLKASHPAQYNYCINTLGMSSVLDYIGIKY